MVVIAAGRDFILRLDPGDEIVSSLQTFINETDILLASVSGIGAISRCEVGRYLLSEKRFEQKTFEGEFEVVAITGNITRMNEKPYLHLHMAFADEDLVMRGGHLKSAVILFTGEIIIRRLDGAVERTLHEATGITRIQAI